MLKFRWETEFKETEIGEVPKDWDLTTLGDANYFEILPSGIERFTGFKEYLSTSSVQGVDIVSTEAVITYEKRPSRANMQPIENSVWFARMINSLKVLKTDEDLVKNKVLSTGFIGIKATSRYSPDYLFYYFQTKQFQEHKDDYVTGGVQESLTNEGATKLFVPLLNKSEQSNIASILSRFDDLIKNKKRQNEILEKTAMAIFKSWFIDFEPFKKEKFTNSELGEIPEGWEVKPIGELTELINGISYTSEEKFEEPIEGGYVFITLNNVLEGGGFKPEYAWIRSDRLKDQHFLEEGDLILANVHFGVGGSEIERLLAAPALVTFPAGYKHKKGAYSMDITKISPFEKNYKFYLYLYLKLTKEDSSSFSTGTSILHLDLNNFRKNKLLIVPPRPILQKFYSLVEPLFQKIITNQKQIMILRKVRDTLLPLLVFGKLRVEDV
jgi:type I restriction enzyme S subunit